MGEVISAPDICRKAGVGINPHADPTVYVHGGLKFANSGRPAEALSEHKKVVTGSSGVEVKARWWTPTARHDECEINQCRNQTIHASMSGEGPRQPECQAPGLLGTDLQMGFGQTRRRATAPASDAETSSLVSSSSMVPSSGMVPSTSLVPSLSSTSLTASSAAVLSSTLVPSTSLAGSLAPSVASTSPADSCQRVNGKALSRVACRHSTVMADEDFDAIVDVEWQRHLGSLGEESARSKNRGGTYWRSWFAAMHLEAEQNPLEDIESEEDGRHLTDESQQDETRPSCSIPPDDSHEPEFQEISYEQEDLEREERTRERLRDQRAQEEWKVRQARPSG